MVWVVMVRVRVVVLAHGFVRVLWLLVLVMLLTAVGVFEVRGLRVVVLCRVRVSISLLLILCSIWVMWVARCVRVGTVGRVTVGLLMLVWPFLMNLSLHVAVVLLSSDIVMLISLLCLLALLHGVLRGRLGPNRFDVRRFISMSSMDVLGVIRLHLEH